MPETLQEDALLRDVSEVDGYKVLGPCVIYHKLGAGGFGAVYRARHAKLDIDVAVKCLHGELLAGDPKMLGRFEREARLAARIDHPNLVRVLDVDCRHGVHYLILEFISGDNLRQQVGRGGPLSTAEAVHVILEAGRALAAAHAEGVVHRDIKPDNIMLSHKGAVKLTDLGLARACDSNASGPELTVSEMMMGTPRYMPPEQWQGISKVGPPGDVWALGATLYFLLTARNAVAGDSTYEVCHQICERDFPALPAEVAAPHGLRAILERCTERDPERRYADAAEFCRALEEFAATLDEPLRAPRPAELGTLQLPADAPDREVLSRVQDLLSSASLGRAAAARETAPRAAPSSHSERDSKVARARAHAEARNTTGSPSPAPKQKNRAVRRALFGLVAALLLGAGYGAASAALETPALTALGLVLLAIALPCLMEKALADPSVRTQRRAPFYGLALSGVAIYASWSAWFSFYLGEISLFDQVAWLVTFRHLAGDGGFGQVDPWVQYSLWGLEAFALLFGPLLVGLALFLRERPEEK